MYKQLLPLGSVVLLKGGDKRVMICGRVQTRTGDNTIFDYSSCYHPEGILGSDSMFFFNHSDIEKIYFLGYQNEEELSFHENVLDKLGELEVRNGEIVEKEVK